MASMLGSSFWLPRATTCERECLPCERATARVMPTSSATVVPKNCATRETTAYNTLRKLGPDSGILCYDRLSSSTTPGSKDNPSWRGPPGNRDAEDHIFCMRFRLKLDDEDTRRRKRT